MHELDKRWIGRTFDDFLFRPQQGVTESRGTLPLSSGMTRTVTLELPILSANMDSVTDWEMAEAMALEGGMGIIHRAMSIDRQAEMVRRVKRTYGAVIEEPFRLPCGTSVRDAKVFARRHNIHAILIEDTEGSGRLAGLLTARDIPWLEELEDRQVDDFMTPFNRLQTSPPGISEEEAERLMFDNRIERLPLVGPDREIRGLITLRDILFFRRRPFSSKDAKGRLLVGAAIGARGDYLERAAALIDANVDCLVIDIAHGHSDVMAEAMNGIRNAFDGVQLVCGNVATGVGAKFLVDRGADAVKVGVGPGRGCRTRLETAAGVPQLQAIREAWCAVGDETPIIADGGVAHDKDIFLALVCGASSVMLGSALSGTDESPGHVIVDPATQTKRKIYRGMTSPQAVFQTHYDDTNGDFDESAFDTPAEGQEIQVPYRGSVVDILQRIRGHLRSAVSYAGESSLAEARRKVLPDPLEYLIPLSDAARRESYER
jgi:IMP dehydrogenase